MFHLHRVLKVRRPPNDMGMAMFLQLNGLDALIPGLSEAIGPRDLYM